MRRSIVRLLVAIAIIGGSLLVYELATATSLPITSRPRRYHTNTFHNQRVSSLEVQQTQDEEAIKHPPKDIWDKLSSVSGIISGD